MSNFKSRSVLVSGLEICRTNSRAVIMDVVKEYRSEGWDNIVVRNMGTTKAENLSILKQLDSKMADVLPSWFAVVSSR